MSEKSEPAKTVANCNNCGGERRAFVQATHSVGDHVPYPIDEYLSVPVGWDTTIEILECCGCSKLSVRRRRWFSEWDPNFEQAEISYWPPHQRPLPEWHSQLTDENLHQTMQEVYVAVSQEMVVLASIGVRTLLDRAFYLLLEKDHGNFAQKLEGMVANGHLLRNQKDIFQHIANVGNAAAHQGAPPTQENLVKILTAVESFLYQKFILPKEAEAVGRETPKREKQEG